MMKARMVEEMCGVLCLPWAVAAPLRALGLTAAVAVALGGNLAHDGAGGAVVRVGASPRGSALPLGLGLIPAACRFGGVAAGFGSLDRGFGRVVLARNRGAWSAVVIFADGEACDAGL